MGDIFISYSRRDSEIVDQFVQSLDKAGIKTWVDREDIEVSVSWRQQIVEAIDACDAFVLMLSSNSAPSANVQKEVILAQDSGRPTFVVMLEVVRLPSAIRYQLAGLQFINFPLLGFEKSAEKLIETVQPFVKKNNPAAAPRQAELVIQGVDLASFSAEKQQQLLAFISNLADTDASKLKIANLAAGSVHAFIDMPSDIAYRLKTLALNGDPRFGQFNIASMRLLGDTLFIHIASGLLLTTATLSFTQRIWHGIPSLFSQTIGLAAGKLLTILIALFVIIGIILLASSAISGGQTPHTASTTTTPLPSSTPIPASATSTATPTSTWTALPSSTATLTATPTTTLTPTPAYQTLSGVINSHGDIVACRYGPGDVYLFEFQFLNGNKITIDGQVEIQNQRKNQSEIWLYGLADGFKNKCWVNSKYVDLNGDISLLEPSYYPNPHAPLILFHHPNFPPPSDVSAERQGNKVNISWSGITLALGDRESANSPMYLVEAWTCQAGQIVFTPIGAFNDYASVVDEPGCSTPSHGQVYLAHKDGYVGPVQIPWP